MQMAMMLKKHRPYIKSKSYKKTVNTKSLKQYKTLFKFHYLSLYSNICNIKKMLYLSCRYQLPSLLNQYNANGNDAENNMDHISSQNPIKKNC